MTISERIIEKMRQLGMSQREFSTYTGIKESTISEWKKNKTNPSSDKILGICAALNVSPEWLLSGGEPAPGRKRESDYYVVDALSEEGILIESFNELDKATRDRVLGYVEALMDIKREKQNNTH